MIINQVDTVQIYEKVRPLQDMLNPENIWVYLSEGLMHTERIIYNEDIE